MDTRSTMRNADLIVVPVQPSPVDGWATEAIIDIAKKEGYNTLMVLNRVTARSRMAMLFQQTLPFLTDAIIGNRVPADGRAVEEAADKAGLKSMARWPVSISYFEPGSGERRPVYVLSFDLYENGVSGALKLDFGDFALKGELKRLEILKETPCTPK
jgi:hypothetical protein